MFINTRDSTKKKFPKCIFLIKIVKCMVGVMAQQLGALVVLAEDLSLSSNTHIAAPVPGSYMPSSGIQEPGIYVVHRHT